MRQERHCRTGLHGFRTGPRHANLRGFVLTFESLAALLVMLAAVMLMLAHPQQGGSRASQLALQMQAEDVAEFIAGEGGMERVEDEKMTAIADALGACVRVSGKGSELFRSECFGKGSDGEMAAAGYFEINRTIYASALVELKRR